MLDLLPFLILGEQTQRKNLNLTISFHVHLQTLSEPARLTLIPPCNVNYASSIFLTHILQIPITQ